MICITTGNILILNSRDLINEYILDNLDRIIIFVAKYGRIIFST